MSLRDYISKIVESKFEKLGFESKCGKVNLSDREDLAQFQVNGALAIAKIQKTNPMIIAEKIVESLKQDTEIFKDVSVAKPGFINLTVQDNVISNHIDKMIKSKEFLIDYDNKKLTILIDYGGPNVGKPLHVGHLRSAIIGECLKRVCAFLGHKVISDVHLGDWGLQMGMILTRLKEIHPDWPYFKENFSWEDYENNLPQINKEEFETVYKDANEKSKSDEKFLAESKLNTYKLQDGHLGLRELWRQFVKISCDDIKRNYDKLQVSFDLWEGESDAHGEIEGMIQDLVSEKIAVEDDGALIIKLDEYNLPPLIIQKSDKSYLYATTELATILRRVEKYNPDEIWYVVDQRQAFHFKQAFSASYKVKIVPETTKLIHLGFGTVNGSDGKPFKTREGGSMKLSDLLKLTTNKARERLDELDHNISEFEKGEIANRVGVGMLKFADLINNRIKDYTFDIDKFSAFDGKTGVYVMYTLIRIKSLLKHIDKSELHPCKLLLSSSELERKLMLKMCEFSDVIQETFSAKEPHILTEYLYELCSIFNNFYHERKILSIENLEIKNSLLKLVYSIGGLIEIILNLLGITPPEKM